MMSRNRSRIKEQNSQNCLTKNKNETYSIILSLMLGFVFSFGMAKGSYLSKEYSLETFLVGLMLLVLYLIDLPKGSYPDLFLAWTQKDTKRGCRVLANIVVMQMFIFVLAVLNIECLENKLWWVSAIYPGLLIYCFIKTIKIDKNHPKSINYNFIICLLIQNISLILLNIASIYFKSMVFVP
jgi:hypothetical protein